MSEIPKILPSNILGKSINDFWQDLPKNMDNEAPKEVLIIAKFSTQNDADIAQLTKILNACKLVEDQYYLLNMKEDEQIAWHRLKAHFQPKTVLLFGVLPNNLGISSLFRLNSANNFNECVFIPALSISQMEENFEAKKQLWENALKPHFIDSKKTNA